MTERPILFSGSMVRALLAGQKTQTRRAVKLPHTYPLGRWKPTIIGGPAGGRTRSGDTIPEQGAIWHTRTGDSLLCPHGQPGDRLWLREAWRTLDELDKLSGTAIAEKCVDAGYRLPWAPIQYEADGTRKHWEHTSTPPHDGEPKPGRYRHARFMPRWASRITLEITDVRVERLNDISEADAEAEGADELITDNCGQIERTLLDMPLMENGHPFRNGFALLWEAINGDGSWTANPWVWVVEFRRIDS